MKTILGKWCVACHDTAGEYRYIHLDSEAAGTDAEAIAKAKQVILCEGKGMPYLGFVAFRAEEET